MTQAVTGTFTNAAGAGTFKGTYTITQFAKQGGSLVAIGTLTGTLMDALGNVIGTITNANPAAVTIPIDLAGTSGACQILHLDLGPLDMCGQYSLLWLRQSLK